MLQIASLLKLDFNKVDIILKILVRLVIEKLRRKDIRKTATSLLQIAVKS